MWLPRCGLCCPTRDKAGRWLCLLWPPHAQGSPGKNFIKYFLCLRHLTYKVPLSPRCIYNSEVLSKLAKKLSGFRPKCVWVHAFSTVSSIQFSHSVVSNSLRPHGLQHTRLPCPSPTPRVYPNSCPLSQWCHLTISSSVVPFSCLQSCQASGSFPMSQFFASGGQSIGVSASASVLPVNIQDWFPLGLTGLISL